MVKTLRILFSFIFILMVSVTIWASFDVNVMEGFKWVWSRPWGLATLADAFCGFITFYAWVAYKEKSWANRIGWLVAILALGNIAMSFYMLRLLFKLPDNATAQDILL